jgi:outer membrane protein assembly factor BamA
VRNACGSGGSGLLALAPAVQELGPQSRLHVFRRQLRDARLQLPGFLGQNGYHLNAELRLPLIHAMATPIGILGGIRGTLFANVGGAYFDQSGFKAYSRDTTTERPITGYVADPLNPTQGVPVFGDPIAVSGFRLVDARASYGIGLQTFALGFPVHFDWAWRTCSTRAGKTWCSRSRAAARRSASPASRCGSA